MLPTCKSYTSVDAHHPLAITTTPAGVCMKLWIVWAFYIMLVAAYNSPLPSGCTLTHCLPFSPHQPIAGVCIKLKELIERLFPRRSKQRKTEVEGEREREKGELQAWAYCLYVVNMKDKTKLSWQHACCTCCRMHCKSCKFLLALHWGMSSVRRVSCLLLPCAPLARSFYGCHCVNLLD